MIMKTRSLLIGVAMAAALNCAAVNAQVLGGGDIGGGLGGTLSGGMRDMNVTTHGAMNGSLGTDLDTGSLRRTTRGTAERATNRARSTTGAVKERAAAKADQTRDTTSTVASTAAASAMSTIDDVQIEGTADVAGSAASGVSRDGVNLAGDAQGTATGAANKSALGKPEVLKQEPGKVANQETPAVPSASEPEKPVESKRALDLAGEGNGSASASRSGVSAQGGGSASASRN
jgi:hypothetical protein